MFDPTTLEQMAAARRAWEARELQEFLARQPEARPERRSASGLPRQRVYTPEDIAAAIRFHHRPEFATEHKTLAAIAGLAAQMTELYRRNVAPEDSAFEPHAALLQTLGIYAARGQQYTFPAEWLDVPLVRDLFAERVKQRLSGLSTFEQVHKFTLLERPFAPESGELTPTLKLRRGVILERNAELIEAMYSG